MSYVIAIDVGIKNLGICVFDFRTSQIVEWDNVSLVRSGRYVPAQNVQYVREFIRRYEHYFNESFQVLVERQMRCNMRIIEAVFEALFDNCIIISARSVKAHYNLSTKNYRANKQKAIEWATRFVENNEVVFKVDVGQFTKLKKQDDMADSLLLVMYYLDTYSNQLTVATEDTLIFNVEQ